MNTNKSDDKFNQYLDKIMEKAKYVCRKNKDRIPYTLDENGNYDNQDYIDKSSDEGGVSWWTNGFFGAYLWQVYNYSKEEEFADFARIQEKKLDKCFEIFNGIHHDVGFMWLITAGANYQQTQDIKSRNRTLHAATVLAGRFNINGRFIRAWNNFESKIQGWAIIDSLMNISLLYWASRETKDPRFDHVANAHAATLQKYFVREDGSCNHIVEFDAYSGDMVTSYGGQGMEQGSSWTRGQAWGLYGFTNTYINSKNKEFLSTAQRIADYFLDHYKEYSMVPVDFIQPKDNLREDNSAACIAASGLLSLARCSEGEVKDKYHNGALEILGRVCEERVDFELTNDALVQQCATAYNDDQSISTLIYADYFLIEALLKIKDANLNMWEIK